MDAGKRWTAFIQSKEGKELSDAGTLTGQDRSYYLSNRLWRAYMCGWSDCAINKMAAKEAKGHESFTITPLGCAVVEAMPDETKVREIEQEFKKSGVCPTSKIFPTDEEVEKFYRDHPESGMTA